MDYRRLGQNGSTYREFPLFAPAFPSGTAGLRELRKQWPLLRGELIRSSRLYRRLRRILEPPETKQDGGANDHPEDPETPGEQKGERKEEEPEARNASEERRAEAIKALADVYHDVYSFPSNITPEECYETFSGFVRKAGRFVRELVETYFVESFREQFSSEGVVEASDDPLELLTFCFREVEPGDAIGRMRAFEARRKLVLAQLLLEISTSQRDDLLEYDKQLLTRLFERSFFTARSERVVITSLHDPARDFETVQILGERTSIPGMKVIETPLTYRHFACFGDEHPVFFEPGVKSSFSHLEKMLRKGIRDPDEIKDLRRYLLVFRNEREMELGLRVLRRQVHSAPGVIHDHSSNMWSDGPADDANPHSFPGFRQKKFVALLDGRRFEGMVQTLPEFLNGKYARNGKNHALYKFRQRLDSTFPIVFPTEIYGIRWTDARVEEKLRSKIFADSQ